MIKKFLKIKRFGSVTNYIANADLNEFKKYNLFFGLNGTGKTMLSNLFRCLNEGRIDEKDMDSNFFKEDFEILDEDSKITEFKDNIYCNRIKIFNRDFVNNNLKLDNNNAQTNAITYTIGETAKDIKEKISGLNIKLSKYYKESQGKRILISHEELCNNEKKLEELYKEIAVKIRVDLQIKNSQEYTLNHFKKDFSKLVTNEIMITENDKNEYIDNYLQPVKNIIPIINIDVITNDNIEEIQKLLSNEVKRADIKEELVQWIEKGLSFEDSDKICPFCHSPVTNWEERYSEIQNIVKKDDSYIEYERRLIELMSMLKSMLPPIKNNLFNLRIDDFYKKIPQEILDNYSTAYNSYQKFIEDTIEILKKKKMLPDNKFHLIDISIVEQYITTKNLLNKLIEENNESIATRETMRQKAKEKVIQYYVQSCKEEVSSLEKQITAKKIKNQEEDNEISNINEEIVKLNAELVNQQAPIAEIEKYISIVFSCKKFTLQYEEVLKSYSIYRDNENIAKNLSEGEKTVIAFAYFLATLKMHNFKLKEAIIVIDDPVSSLDQQYLFNLINLLGMKFNAPSSFYQLFILTHNFYFFKKVRAILQYKKENKENLYELFQITKGNSSIIENADNYLRNFTSEYVHTIKYLRECLEFDETRIKEIPIGNSIRKIFEIFLAFRCPRKSSISQRFDVVTKEFSEEEKGKYLYLQDIANASSHTEECEDIEVLEEFKLFVTKNEIKQLFSFIKLIDEKHYKEIMKL